MMRRVGNTFNGLYQEFNSNGIKTLETRYVDGAINGYGGCPMAKDELTGNMPTEHLIMYFHERKLIDHIKLDQFYLAMNASKLIFDNYH